MAKIDQIEAVSDKLAETTIKVLPRRCLYMRNWNSKCRACLNACRHEAIQRMVGRIEIDDAACTDCGACVSVCPTSTMLSSAPDAGSIVKSAQASAAACGGNALFMCARDAASTSIDTSRVVVLPCLDYLDEYLLAGLFAYGVKAATLMRLGCGECELNGPAPRFEQMVGELRELFELWGVEGTLRLTKKVPEALVVKHQERVASVGQVGRRDAFKDAGNQIAGFITQAVGEEVDKYAGQASRKKDGERVLVRMEERFDVGTYRSARLLKMLDRIGTRPRGKHVDSRFWADLSIDESRCRYCGMCAQNCITRALRFAQDDEKQGTLIFQPAKCVGCRLCHDACLSHAMVYSTMVKADDLDEGVVKVLYEDKKDPLLNPLLPR